MAAGYCGEKMRLQRSRDASFLSINHVEVHLSAGALNTLGKLLPTPERVSIVWVVSNLLTSIALITLVASGALAACALPEQDNDANKSAVSETGKYESAAYLRKAAVELGYECPDWSDTPEEGVAPAIGLAESSGTCGNGGDQFLAYGPGRGSFGGDAYTVKDQFERWQSDFGLVPGTHTLTGPNWIITLEKNSGDYETLAKKLGGKVHH